jgi:8-oxo-dGTP diphosphatase
VACDVVVVRFCSGRLQVLLIERRHDPYAGFWALPGGFVDINEDLPAAAAREAEEETGMKGLRLFPLGMFGAPGRDPRGRVISAAWLALLRPGAPKPQAGDDARKAAWFSLLRPPPLAFDHALILRQAKIRLRELLLLTPHPLELMGPSFTPEDFRLLSSEIMGRKYPPGTFISRLQKLPGLVPAADRSRLRYLRSKHRPGDFISLLLT